MRGSMWLMALGCGILLSSSGCCGFLRNGSCGQGSGYESCGRSYGDCGPTCGPVDRPYRQRIYGNNGGGCNACGDECGSSCQSNFCFHPFQWIGKLFYAGTWCGPSCRNTYWGEVVSDPPACREPCNCNGQYTGRSGCASCNRGAAMQESGDMSPYPTGTMLPDDPEPIPAPQTPTKAMRRPAADSYDR